MQQTGQCCWGYQKEALAKQDIMQAVLPAWKE